MKIARASPETILTTGHIADDTGINKSVVSRALKVLTQQAQVKKIKSGEYQLVSPVLSEKWTKEDNRDLINRLLEMYDRNLPVWSRWLKFYCMKGEFDTAVKMLKSMTDTLDLLLHRWAILNKGYDANPEQARQDVQLAKALQPPPEETEEDNKIRHWDAEKKKIIDSAIGFAIWRWGLQCDDSRLERQIFGAGACAGCVCVCSTVSRHAVICI